jgi:hypothetical protein
MPYRRHQHCSGLQRLVKDASHPLGFVLDKPLKVWNQTIAPPTYTDKYLLSVLRRGLDLRPEDPFRRPLKCLTMRTTATIGPPVKPKGRERERVSSRTTPPFTSARSLASGAGGQTEVMAGAIRDPVTRKDSGSRLSLWSAGMTRGGMCGGQAKQPSPERQAASAVLTPPWR